MVRLRAFEALRVLAAGVTLAAPPAGARPAATQFLPVPMVSQATPWTCGAAALMSALLYFGVFDDPESRLDAELAASDDPESRLDAELAASPELGVNPLRMAATARRYGVDAEVRTGLTLDDLAAELDRRAVVIVAIQAWPSHPVVDWSAAWDDGHYVVLVGIDDRRVYVMDPSLRTGYGYLPRGEFLQRWHDRDSVDGREVVYDRLGIVIRGQRALPRYPAAPTHVD
jgi:predicted double-glycine peptidase